VVRKHINLVQSQPHSPRRVGLNHHKISQIFLDAIKSAWLLVDIREETSFLEDNWILDCFVGSIEMVGAESFLRDLLLIL
jgi:hypothetical protein